MWGGGGCSRPHLLHPPKLAQTQPASDKLEAEGQELSCLINKKSTHNQVLFRMVPVTVSGPVGQVHTFALLDEVSTVMLIAAAIARDIGPLPGLTSSLTLNWMNGASQADNWSHRVIVKVHANNQEFELSDIRTTRQLDLPTQQVDLPTQQVDLPSLRDRWRHIANAKGDLLNCTKPWILIGQDNCHLIVPREVVEAPMLSRYKLGWTVHGRSVTSKIDSCDSSLVTPVVGKDNKADVDLIQLVKEAFKTEALGVKVVSEQIRFCQ